MNSMDVVSMTITSERELLDTVRRAIEAGQIPRLTIDGDTYDFPLTYLLTEGEHCKWCSKAGLCGLADFGEDPKCNGIENCRRI